jgi:hypothetical protein
MANTRATEEKSQTTIGPEAMDIETNSPPESKEEKVEVAVRFTKDEVDGLNKKFLASYAAAFRTFCIATSPTGLLRVGPAFYFLGKIPGDIFLNNIFPFLVSEFHIENRQALKRVERPSSLFFRGQLLNVRLKQLLQHIAYGEKDKAEAIIAADPRLLLLSGPIVKDYAGREIQQYPYQMALAAADVFVKFKKGVYQPGAQGEEMKEMIERYFIKLVGEEKGVAELERQRKMIFPDDFEEYIKQKRAEDLAAVTEMFNALGAAEALDEEGLLEECGKALKKFKTHLEPKGIITATTQGYHFDPQILVKAYKLYDANYITFGNDWNSPKNLFAWQKVIGLIQCYLTACDAMVLCQGPYYLVQDGEPFKRTLNFRFGGGVYFSLDSDPTWSIGKNAAGELVGRVGVVGRGAGGARVWAAVGDDGVLSIGGLGGGGCWKSYVEQKHRRCECLCNAQTITQRLGA